MSCESYGYKNKQPFYSVNVSQMCIFNVESACLHDSIPFQSAISPLGTCCFFGFIERYDNL